ncbi:putative transmembrane HlyD type I secretion protein [Magnetospirillum fulvum MGU-K5]|uniref:Membrane fusion protein (MFP) family protein n=2 Tax=Magnetospirillum fulvum TaxID=1082 RepID=S9S916_MAGFU|nr:putative transmembrane HlyD type I secretion protein [Magnetospirillum fulvum MGU-K5]
MCVAALAVAVLWAALATTEEIVYATGKLNNIRRTVVVQPLETSVIREIHVREGQRVTKGQPLITLDPTLTGSDLAQTEIRWRVLNSQKRRVQAELEVRPFVPQGSEDASQASLYLERQRSLSAKQRSLEGTIAKTKAELTTTKRSVELLTERLKTVADLEKMQTSLFESQIGSKARMLSSRDQRLDVETTLSQAINRIQELRHSLTTAEAEREIMLREWQQKLNEELVSVSRDLDEIGESVEKARYRKNLAVLTAPVDGVVLEVAKRSTASVVREAEQLVVIAPADVHMEIDARIDARDIGLVVAGTVARIKVDTFPYQKFGTLPGVVSVVSSDSFTRDANETTPSGSGSSSRTYFIAQITLGNDRLRSQNGKDAILTPGMTVSVEIVIGRRSVLSYLLRPLAETVDEALHEP